MPERADPRDALCGAASIAELAEGAAVGTASLRRRSQLLALRPDLDVRDVRGNVDTRLRKLAEGDYDALVLAAAGLARLGRVRGRADPRGGDDARRRARAAWRWRCAPATTRPARAAGARDRSPGAGGADGRARGGGRRLEATCHTPVGARARLEGDELTLDAYAGLPDGTTWVRDRQAGGASATRPRWAARWPSGCSPRGAADVLAA